MTRLKRWRAVVLAAERGITSVHEPSLRLVTVVALICALSIAVSPVGAQDISDTAFRVIRHDSSPYARTQDVLESEAAGKRLYDLAKASKDTFCCDGECISAVPPPFRAWNRREFNANEARIYDQFMKERVLMTMRSPTRCAATDTSPDTEAQ